MTIWNVRKKSSSEIWGLICLNNIYIQLKKVTSKIKVCFRLQNITLIYYLIFMLYLYSGHTLLIYDANLHICSSHGNSIHSVIVLHHNLTNQGIPNRILQYDWMVDWELGVYIVWCYQQSKRGLVNINDSNLKCFWNLSRKYRYWYD